MPTAREGNSEIGGNKGFSDASLATRDWNNSSSLSHKSRCSGFTNRYLNFSLVLPGKITKELDLTIPRSTVPRSARPATEDFPPTLPRNSPPSSSAKPGPPSFCVAVKQPCSHMRIPVEKWLLVALTNWDVVRPPSPISFGSLLFK